MISTLIIAFLSPIAVTIGLLLFKNVYLAFILYQGICCIGIPIFDLLIIKKLNFQEVKSFIGLDPNRKSIITGFFYGFIFFLTIILFFIIFKNTVINPDSISQILQNWHIRRSHLFSLLFFMIVSNSILEEIYWRGYIFKRLTLYLKPQTVIIVTSLFYASYHLIITACLFNFKIGFLFTIVILFTGVFWGVLRFRFKSIVSPLISHFWADLAIMIIYLIFIHNIINS
jgi:membrane protease YdiL (CAAX protease family)